MNMNYLLDLSRGSLYYLKPALEIGILALLIYSVLYSLRGTRASNILAGIVIILIILTSTSDAVSFEVISWLLNNLWAMLGTALIVIFQPELRRAFAQLGSNPFLHYRIRKQEAINEVANAAINMSNMRIGALMVFEREIGMSSIIGSAIQLDIKLNSLIIESIFYPNSPLHDGAMIIKDDKIIAAHAILPLSQDEDSALSNTLGTRHRAAIGITEETDAVALLVSEETGKISIAFKGRLKQDVKSEKLLRYLNGLLISKDSSFGFFDSAPGNDKDPLGFDEKKESE
ncbi:MAG: TIGR00159 family protein [Lentisphaerae bacterium GWF2_52_8]|nr:MAG: TIGR00159 family protein [Lentisphaerae bacterium GWF2_52_8]